MKIFVDRTPAKGVFMEWFSYRCIRNPIGGVTIDNLSMIRQKDPIVKMKLGEVPYPSYQEDLLKRYRAYYPDANTDRLSLYFYVRPMAILLGESDDDMFFGQKNPLFLNRDDFLYINRCFVAVDTIDPGVKKYEGNDINSILHTICDQFFNLIC